MAVARVIYYVSAGDNKCLIVIGKAKDCGLQKFKKLKI